MVRTENAIRRRLRVCTLVVVALLTIAPRVSAQTLTNADVIKMVQAKLGDAVIVSEIKHSTCKFDTSPHALIELKQAGVSDAVLQAMTEAGHSESDAGGSVAASNSNVNIPVPENYGVYAAADGKLLGIDVPTSTMTPPKVSVRVREGGPYVPVPGFRPPPPTEKRISVLPAGLVFVQFGRGHEIDPGKLWVIPYIRDGSIDAWNFEGGIDGSAPTIPLLARPMAGHPDVTILSPAKPLAPGVYGLRTGPGEPFFFAVGQLAEAERLHCFENDETTPCRGGSASTPTTALSPSGQPSAQPAASSPTNNSPSEVSAGLEMACNDGKYAEAIDDFSSKLKAAINGPWGRLNGGIQGICNRQTRNSTLRRVEILKVEVQGEGATVFYRLRYKDGTTREDHDDLIKENGEWKVNH